MSPCLHAIVILWALRCSTAPGRIAKSRSTRLHGITADVARVPRIERVTYDAAAGHIAVTATVAGKPIPDRACVWISDGQTVHTDSTLPYRRVTGIGTYVCAEITGDGGTTYTNPFGFVRREP